MNLKETALEVIYAIIPVTILVIVLQLTIVKMPSEVFANFIAGTIMIIVGFFLFLTGVRISLLPIGEYIGSALVKKGRLWIVLFFGFILGFVVTIAEPSVQILSIQVDSVTGDSITRNLLVIAVSLGVAIFLALALLRIVLNIPLVYMLIGGYSLVFILSMFSSPEFLAVSFDAGGVTTGPMTVPFILAFGVGVTSMFGNRKSEDNSFGLVALASIGPILAILILGVYY
ncbi:DUF1538 domain-containing protein [Herbivorax sp. ANBcel31]|uniref:DUF1538 domain-containing protein n=1 Tax=Herbivorax sp. ANBcel31 TaxID=3069754 RepID=UPI0027B7233E|nr:DUF1538 domain-containing protein [Herbivorax sp. ANBcel31]MDQ2086573.1 DUF1538 domain-containing protein [Herbivorax sp. ANBcel31]